MAVFKSLSRIATVFFTLALASCAVDLGTFEGKGDNYKTYYDSFGEVQGLYDGGKVNYDVEKSLFNEKTMKEFTWDKDEDAVKDLPYLYMVIPFKESLKIQSVAFYVRSQVTVTLEMSLFYFDGASVAPEKIKYLTSPSTETIYDSENNPIGEKEIKYDDPPVSESMIHGNLELIQGDYVSVGFGPFQQKGYEDDYLHAGKDGLLYIRIENNSGFNVGRLPSASFTFINLLVRAVE